VPDLHTIRLDEYRIKKMTWILLWKTVLILALAAFTVMAVFVTVLGARDIRKLLAALRDPEDDSDD
jgi:hypothetical protein